MIDILLASYNGAKYIEEQINSILNQTYFDWRLIIRDDNSIDETVKIIEKLQKKDKRIHIINDEKYNLGLVKNFERLLSYSTADYIMFADQDDIWFPNKVELTFLTMQKRNQDIPQLVFSNSTVIQNNISVKSGNLYKFKVEPKLKNFLFSNAGYQGSTSMINKVLKNKCLPFPDNCIVHDYHISFCALLFGEVTYIQKSTMYYRKHPNSTTILKQGIINKFRSILMGETLLFDIRLKNYLINYIEEKKNDIDNNKKVILNEYFRIISQDISKGKALRIAFKRRFSQNGSCIYLLIKIFLLK